MPFAKCFPYSFAGGGVLAGFDSGFEGGELLAVEAVNNPKDYVAARRLIAERARPDIDKLADPRTPLKDSV